MPEESAEAPSDVHLLTTDVLLDTLIAGRSVRNGSDGTFTLSGDDARAVLAWYRRNRARWAGNLTAGDADALVDALAIALPEVPSARTSATGGGRRTLRLIKVVAHRFAGLHAYGRSSEPPPTFEFEPTAAVTLLEGANGSGKTSLMNAVVWCLTGHLIRSQRAPEEGPTEFECSINREGSEPSKHMMSAVTPMPHAGSDLPPEGTPIGADTWVELTFADQDGNLIAPVRRTQSRTSRGKIQEESFDAAALGIDPVSLRIGTTMPALIPFIPVGSPSQLGQAVARLTGLAEIVDLAKHAGKAATRIAGQMTDDRKGELDAIDLRFAEASTDLVAAFVEYEPMRPDQTLPQVGDADCADRLQAVTDHLSKLKAEGLASARDILGDGFDAEDKAARDGLEQCIRPAIEQLKQVTQLAGVTRLSDLKLETPERAAVDALLAKVESEAATLSALTADAGVASRSQLYARVSAWMHDHQHPEDGACPVCTHGLDGARDPVTGGPVADHLAAAGRDREVVSKTVTDWASGWVGRLAVELPAPIRKEARQDLPEVPADLLREGLVDDLFATEGFSGVLAALRPAAADLFEKLAATLPAFTEPKGLQLPDALGAGTLALQRMLDRTARAVAFAEWRQDNAQALRDLVQAMRRDGSADGDQAIGPRLAALLEIVEGVAPINKAADYVARMDESRRNHAAKQDRIDACARAAAGLRELIPLGDLAQTQVETLRDTLHDRSEHWRKLLYRNATSFAPDLTGTAMDARGSLEFQVGRDGVAAPAQHVSNASALRAALLGFFLAFREHVLATRGGMELLVLDDPQELLDNDNRERMARGLATLGKDGAQILATTHDRKFALSLVNEGRARECIAHLSVHAVNPVRPTLSASPAIEEIDRKRVEFRNNPDSASHAQDYAGDVRVFLEARLGDLFDDTPFPTHAASTRPLTLIPLVDKLRGLVGTRGSELLRNPVVVRFASDAALAEGAEVRRVLNTAHHDRRSLTYMDVKSVEAELGRLRTDVEAVHEQFRLFRWREPLAEDEQPASNVVVLRPAARPSFDVHVCPDIAAFAGRLPAGGSQDTSADRLTGEWFEGKSLYFVRGDSLGFAIPSGAVAIVESEAYPGRDQNLVVAIHRDTVFARRLVKSRAGSGVSLSAQMPDPRARRPTVTFEESKVRLHRVVGALFTTMPPPAGGSEATLVDTVPELGGVQVAYRVREESAVPLALPGQVILGGPEIALSDLGANEGELAAVLLSDGGSVFKRIGARLTAPLGHLMQLESIGGLGSSLVVATEPLDDGSDIPVVVSARRVLGVLYEG